MGVSHFAFRVALLGVITLPAFSFAAVIASSSPFVGITRYDVTDTVNDTTFAFGTGGRNIHYQLVKIDPAATGVSFETTPSNGAGTLDTTTSTTANYVSSTSAAIGINGGYFDLTGASNVNLVSLAVSSANFVSPWPSPASGFGINVSANNIVTFIKPDTSSSTYNSITLSGAIPVTLYNAIGSNYMSVHSDAKTGVVDDGQQTARTAVGTKGNSLYFFAIDSSSAASTGLTPIEVGYLLHDTWGLNEALNLDGGGSTQMAMRNSRGTTYINTPESASSPRAVGNNFAVKATAIAAGTFNALDDFEATDASSGLSKSTSGHFVSSVGTSGSNVNVAASSTNSRVTTQAHSGAGSLQLTLNDSSTTAGLSARFLSGAAQSTNNVRFDSSGNFGYWLKTTTPNLTTAPVMDDDLTGGTLEIGTSRAVTADNLWHLYSWNLNDPTDWASYVGLGNGQIDNPGVSLNSLIFETSTPGNATLFLDDVGYTQSGAIPIPEPTTLALLALTVPFLLRQKRESIHK